MKKISTHGDRLPAICIKILAGVSIALIIFIFIFIFYQAWPVIQASGLELLTTHNFDTQISEAFYSSAQSPVLNFGLLGLILGTLITTALALIIAVVIGIGASIAICEFAPPILASALKAIIRLLASIPSVVFGLIGIIAVVPYIQDTFVTSQMQMDYLSLFQITGKSLMASAIVLTFMIVPTVISLSMDAISAVPHAYRETGFAFGMTHFRVIWKILLPTARSGIIASVILAAGRGIGEAIAVSMVCGGVGILPDFSHGFVSLLAPVLPLSAAIVNKSEAMSSTAVRSALFACAAILLVMGALLSIGAKLVERQMRRAVGFEK